MTKRFWVVESFSSCSLSLALSSRWLSSLYICATSFVSEVSRTNSSLWDFSFLLFLSTIFFFFVLFHFIFIQHSECERMTMEEEALCRKRGVEWWGLTRNERRSDDDGLISSSGVLELFEMAWLEAIIYVHLFDRIDLADIISLYKSISCKIEI